MVGRVNRICKPFNKPQGMWRNFYWKAETNVHVFISSKKMKELKKRETLKRCRYLFACTVNFIVSCIALFYFYVVFTLSSIVLHVLLLIPDPQSCCNNWISLPGISTGHPSLTYSIKSRFRVKIIKKKCKGADLWNQVTKDKTPKIFFKMRRN